MTEEERREMMRRNYAAQMEMMGYDASGNPLDDIVRVVRCRDCKYGEPDVNGSGEDMVMCQNKLNPIGDGDWIMPPEFYCADGERRDSE